jgi:hypothetical protein
VTDASACPDQRDVYKLSLIALSGPQADILLCLYDEVQKILYGFVFRPHQAEDLKIFEILANNAMANLRYHLVRSTTTYAGLKSNAISKIAIIHGRYTNYCCFGCCGVLICQPVCAILLLQSLLLFDSFIYCTK